MKTLKLFLPAALFLVFSGAGLLWAQQAGVLKQADDLDWIGRFQDAKALLMSAAAGAATPVEQAAVHWRLARVTLHIVDDGLAAKRLTTDQALKGYEEGEAFADKAIQLNPAIADSYFWKSSCIGKWGQAKGIFDSLAKAQPMYDNLKLTLKYDPNSVDAFYVLGELYEKLPGWPISFGNNDYAVSLGRKSIDLMDAQFAAGSLRGRNYSAYLSLANHLWIRNWDANRRTQAKADELKQYNARTDYLEKNFFYEGTLSLKPVSDRDEARSIAAFVIGDLESIPQRNAVNESDLKDARAAAASFK